jgi:hypothetical protein
VTLPAGIDISHWQATTPGLGGLSFVVCRTTYGLMRDRLYDIHSAAVLRAGLRLGAYHFGRSARWGSISSQVTAFLARAGNAHFLVLDLESDGSPSMTNAEARAFIAGVRSRDTKRRRIGLYHSFSGFPADLGQDFNWPAAWRSTPPAMSWALWQYHGGPLDRDWFHGTSAQLHVFGAPPVVNPPAPPPIPDTVVHKAGVLAPLHLPRAFHLYTRHADGSWTRVRRFTRGFTATAAPAQRARVLGSIRSMVYLRDGAYAKHWLDAGASGVFYR